MTLTRGSRQLRPLLALAVFALTLAGALYYAAEQPSQYTGTAVVQFSPKPTKNGGVVGGETVASAAAGYVAYLGAPLTIQTAADAVGVSSADLKDGLVVTLLPATTTVSISYTSTDPPTAVRGANAMADSAVGRAANDPLVSAVVLARAAEPKNPSGPQRLVLAAAGLMLAILLGLVALVVFVYLPSREWSLSNWLSPLPKVRLDGRGSSRDVHGPAPNSSSDTPVEQSQEAVQRGGTAHD